jgi:hypothetical protein
MKNILISFENLQEFYDLILVCDKLKDEGCNVYLFDTTNLYKLNDELINKNKEIFTKIFLSKNNADIEFNSLSKKTKIKLLFQNIKYISHIIKDYKIDLLLTGVTLSLFRYTKLLNNIKYISYIRGIIANPEDYSLSAKIYAKTNLKFLSPLYCDKMAIVSPINIEYFYGYGKKDNDLIKCGPLHLDEIKKEIKQNKDTPTIIFATSAFSHHHLDTLNNEQLDFLEELLKIYNSEFKDKYGFILRIHPRDDIKIYDNLIQKYNIKLNNEPIEIFLKSVSKNKILLSALSTLNFEWEYLGGKSLFYSGENIYKTHQDFYENLNIQPIFNPNKVFDNLNTKDNLSKYFYSHQEGNIDYLINEIKKVSN